MISINDECSSLRCNYTGDEPRPKDFIPCNENVHVEMGNIFDKAFL